ncbi:ThuA domain-containing protein [Sunxiuqinia sp. A32]|uniref:ThuA domain-containing protein n=1 Tax=Sunxiuqinia sp. A32 TaxID=3461496 RepID=UPI0040468173
MFFQLKIIGYNSLCIFTKLPVVLAGFLMFFLAFTNNITAQDVHVLVVTGGHEFDRQPFEAMFNSLGIAWDESVQPAANQLIEAGETDQYDVLVFYDMYQTITETQKKAFVNLLKKGKPMLFLHHAIVSYQNWPEFKNVVGGKYYEEQLFKGIPDSGYSSYKHDVNVSIKLLDEKHPVTKSLSEFELYDEVYGNTEVLSNVHLLLETDHRDSKKYIGWENKYGNSSIIYLQPGHAKDTYQDSNYRQLLKQSIMYLNTTNYTN